MGRAFFYSAVFSTALAFGVIVLGAYTRLTDAGLGCPDWPACYGHWLVTDALTPDVTKAWTEMVHRYVASILGLCIIGLFLFSLKIKQHRLLTGFLVTLVIAQGMLGMWTVTLKLYPIVVMAHLLGGMSTLALLGYLTLTLKNPKPFSPPTTLTLLSLLALILQIFLGGWTSANYAALVCNHFPSCQEHFIHPWKLEEALQLFSAGVEGSVGTPLTEAARITIHMLHRFGALMVSLLILFLGIRAVNTPLRRLSFLLLSLLALQITLGITNVLALLPLPVAVSHNGVSALLLLTLIAFYYYEQRSE